MGQELFDVGLVVHGIAARIMSNKTACSSYLILIDVKVGTGAFMRNEHQARALYGLLIDIARNFNRKVVVAIVGMSQPLRNAAGNSLEVAEAIETLKGGGPRALRELCVYLCDIISHALGLQRSL